MARISSIIAAIIFCSGGVLALTSSEAAELRLRSDARTNGNMVRLSDVADILGAEPGEAQSLGQTELVPTPQTGKQRPLSVREIQDILERRGVNMLQCHFTGASQVIITQTNEPAKPKGKVSVSNSSVHEAQQAVAAAIVQLLQRSTGTNKAWNVDVELTDAQAQAVLADMHHLAVRGGQPPWVGPQKFEIEIRSDSGPSLFTVAANVSAPSTVVVTVKEVPRGTIIQSDDVQLQRLQPGADVGDAFQSLEDVIGREAQLPIAPGQVLDPQYVRIPIMVKRGSVVTVFVQAPGIKIRTTGRVRDDGGRGEQVNVESLLDRRTFLAKVTGIDQVEVTAETTTMPQETSLPMPNAAVNMRKPLTKLRLATRPIAAESLNNSDTTGTFGNR